jgi:alginate O-acetyltransferase complex protein AlgI
MALGLGKMFGFELPENFNLPYIAKSIKEFWRRWHISLSTWFRDYVYIPLGGSKKGEARTYFNLIIVFTLTGFWHGASWSFIFWGLFHGFFLLMERMWLEKILSRIPKILQWSYTLLIVMIGWVFFRVEDFSNAMQYVLELFAFDVVGKSALFYLNKEFIFMLFFGILFAVFSWKPLLNATWVKSPILEFAKNSMLLLLFFYCTLKLTNSSYNPFIYFNF